MASATAFRFTAEPLASARFARPAIALGVFCYGPLGCISKETETGRSAHLFCVYLATGTPVLRGMLAALQTAFRKLSRNASIPSTPSARRTPLALRGCRSSISTGPADRALRTSGSEPDLLITPPFAPSDAPKCCLVSVVYEEYWDFKRRHRSIYKSSRFPAVAA